MMTGGKRHKLKKINCDYSIYSIIGIKSPLQDYRLAHFLNKSLDVDFTRINDFIMYDEQSGNKDSDKLQDSFGLFETQELGSKNYSFPTYYFEDDLYKLSYLLLLNNTNGKFLIKDKNNADYILIIFNSYDFPAENLFSKINSISGVSKSYKIDFDNNFDDLFEEIEDHLIHLNKKDNEEK
ncbi:IPExxxVDY family protein [Bacteroidales bacterium OttesenSCG-928-K03]|nr:IPExxxVDY family protein [Bacteroidales bacterium OttesenSCG-928-K22]MDL2242565.1 IPExxxVDY family protein [Bacteroidales bacterium OttesenSCG-928-K03]